MKFTVIGAGNTGQAIAGYVASKGHEVLLFSRDGNKAEAIRANGLRMSGELKGYAFVHTTSDAKEASEFGEFLLVCTVSEGHKDVARMLKPYLVKGQKIIIFNGNWGALEFERILGKDILNKGIEVAETGAMLLISKASKTSEVYVKKIKEAVTIASLSHEKDSELIGRLAEVFPQFKLANSVFETSLNNSNTILHTPISLFNSARIEGKQEFKFYKDGASKSIIEYIEKMDSERLEIGEMLKVQTISVLDIINSFWVKKYDDLYRCIHMNDSYKLTIGPDTLNHRYVYEDVPYGLVPLSELGKRLRIPMPYIDITISAFELLMKEKFRDMGPDLDYDSIINRIVQ